MSSCCGPMIRRQKSQMLMGLILGMGLLAQVGVVTAAGPVYWDMPGGLPFAECRLDGVRITADGYLAPGLARKSTAPVDAGVIWVTVGDGQGGFFLGTGHEGRILKQDSAGKISPWADLDCDEVLSLLALPGGGVVAGCEPDGQVFLLDAEGTITKVGEVPGGYVWSMARDDNGLVYLATGNPAGVSVLDPLEVSMHEILSLPVKNALDVIFDATGNLLVATQGPGLVYSLDPEDPLATLDVVLEAAQDEISGFVRGPQGDICALALGDSPQASGTMATPETSPERPARHHPTIMSPGKRQNSQSPQPPTMIYNLELEDGPRILWAGDLDLMSVAYLEGWGWIGGGLQGDGNQLTVLSRLVPPGDMEMLTSWQGGDIISIEPGSVSGSLRVVQANPSQIDVIGPGEKGPQEALGPILDAGHKVTWGRLLWTGNTTETGIRWSVRTGNRETVDGTWSDWSSTWGNNDHKLVVPATRYMQWRADFSHSKPGTAVGLVSVTVSAWGNNRAPSITKFRLEGLQSVRSGGLMVQRSNLTRTFTSGLKAEFNRQDVIQRPQPAERAKLGNSVRVFSWVGSDPDRDRLQYELACRQRGTSTWMPVATGDDPGLAAWETAVVPDGIYDVRLTLDDILDNPSPDNLVSERVYGPVVIDNTPPVIRKLKVKLAHGALALAFGVEDAVSPLAGAFLVWPNGERIRLDPQDHVCDSQKENFVVAPKLPAEDDLPQWVQVEVLDVAGNLVTAKTLVEAE